MLSLLLSIFAFNPFFFGNIFKGNFFNTTKKLKY